ncbi:MAG TPA: hypothetical protein VFI39_04320 [Gemmatimonadales bacterium]|nr:hypothetical protein [Gemmatimonadales bacterium]
MTTENAGAGPTWAAIDAEKRRDRFLRRLNFVAWSVVCVILLGYAVVIGTIVVWAAKRSAAGAGSVLGALPVLLPLIQVVGLVCLLVAVLTTIAIFLRLRTANLAEIQLRLAALERMLASPPDQPRG